MNVPNATYRIQFNKDFTFSDLRKWIPYLRQLGVDAIYASPIFRAVPGSMHGYDITDPSQINPEIGTLSALRDLSYDLATAGIGWIQDIVPNHMALHPNNTWLCDVLEHGPESAFSDYFDTAVANPDYFSARWMLPILDAQLDDVIADGRLTIQLDGGKPMLVFHGQQWPINTKGIALLQQHAGDKFPPGLVREVVDVQFYELCHWQDTNSRISYRRFFTVNGLIGVNVDTYRVFQATHRLIGKLVKEGVFTGLRVDHVDGLADPTEYLIRLRQLVGHDTYLVVEKILQHDEMLPTHWPIAGTTGYDFLAKVNGVLVAGKSERQLSTFYVKLVGQASPTKQLYDAKRSQLQEAMAGELDNLYCFFAERLLTPGELPQPLDGKKLKAGLAAFVIHCPVYRWYGSTFPLSEPEAEAVRETMQAAAQENPDLREELSLLETYMAPATLIATKRRIKDLSTFFQRCMQLTGALMAKGLEDTLMYTYHRHVGINDVGGTPAIFQVSVDNFHRFMEERARYYPLAMNASATHDTKRGEDVRARLHVLTAYPRVWITTVRRWLKSNAVYKVGGMPDVNDEYFIYQTLWGTYPMPGQSLKGYRERLEAYLVKALREAKRHTGWTSPDQTYETETLRFVRRILRADTVFLKEFRALQAKLMDVAIINSLIQVVLKFTCPGIPDTYQGCEGWDLSFVDPDNRRPVDFSLRSKWQEKLSESRGTGAGGLAEWWKDRYTGMIKYGVTEKLLQLRRARPTLFAEGDYESIPVFGSRRTEVLAFVRRHKNEWLLVVAPLKLPVMEGVESFDEASLGWGNMRIRLPGDAPGHWKHAFSGVECQASGTVRLDGLLPDGPIGVWTATAPERPNKRAAGVLLPIFSLPGPYGIGDLGQGAYKFADFMRQASLRYWLMLPHHPTDAEVGYSPYTTRSALAGNTLFLSLDEFVRQGWLSANELRMHRITAGVQVDYVQAQALKHVFFGKAFHNYQRQWAGKEEPEFRDFCEREAYWLTDFADFMTLKARFQGKPWYEWETPYRHREAKVLEAFRHEHTDSLLLVKWLQYQFDRQWQLWRAYCHRAGIQLIGDLPFYVGHDAADVWAQPQLFNLNAAGGLLSRAGVPPDYFNADGQDWGMPIYRWDNHAAGGYDWWINRIRKNLERYDLMRLDHFRAYHDYWEIPAQAASAKEGKWQAGPGKALFQALRNALRSLPFIAEDLGDIHEEIYQLRDELRLPGMKVLQFGFGDDASTSLHAPHFHKPNDVVFTGTHDNNSTAGWFRDELPDEGRQRLKAYLGVNRMGTQQAVEAICRMAYASPAKLAIFPMQDLLRLGSESRMNVPAAPHANWLWRLRAEQLTPRLQQKWADWANRYGR